MQMHTTADVLCEKVGALSRAIDSCWGVSSTHSSRTPDWIWVTKHNSQLRCSLLTPSWGSSSKVSHSAGMHSCNITRCVTSISTQDDNEMSPIKTPVKERNPCTPDRRRDLPDLARVPILTELNLACATNFEPRRSPFWLQSSMPHALNLK